MLSGAILCAQSTASSVAGTLFDPAGAVVPGAECQLTNQATAASSKVASTSSGTFTFPAVLAGVYQLTVRAPGFKRLELNDIRVTASEVRALGKLTLEVGEVRDSISVAGEAASVQFMSAERSGLVTGAQLNDIALKGRDFFAFLSTVPGIVDTNGN